MFLFLMNTSRIDLFTFSNVKKDTPLADYQNYPELFLNMNEKTGTPELDDIDISLQNSARYVNL